jgi:PAS domain S-box-containing protein
VKGLTRDWRCWAIAAMMLALTVLHYAEWLNLPFTLLPSEHFGLSRHSFDRILFLVPVVYAGYAFRLRIGLATALVAFLIMLPRCIALSPARLDALLETDGVLLVGVLACFWFESRSNAREQQQRAIRELESVQENLQTQVRLSRSNAKKLATLNAISGMVSGSLEPERILRGAIDMVMEVMEVEVTLIFLIEEKAAGLRLAAYEGIDEKLAGQIARRDLWRGFNDSVVHQGQPALIENFVNNDGILRSEKIHCMLTVPLRARAVITGTLCVGNRRPRKFLPEDMELLTAIGAQVGIAMENTKLYHKEKQMVAQYRSIFENATEAIWLHDLDGDILTANRATTRLTGYLSGELVHMNAGHFLSTEALADVRQAESRVLSGETAAGEALNERIIRKDSTEVSVRLSLSPIYEDDRLAGFQCIAMDITKERVMEQNLRHYIEAITQAQEQERKRIARELHDDTAQQLIALSHQLEEFSTGNPRLSAADIESLNAFHRRLKEAMYSVRIFSRDLRPPMIDDLGLVPALEWLVEHLNSESRMGIEMKINGAGRRLAPEAELSIFRIVQEALSNVRRHAEATSVNVKLEFGEPGIAVAVEDNGKGFDVPDLVGGFSRQGKLGLAGMEERARLLGAELGIESRPGAGTVIRLRLSK